MSDPFVAEIRAFGFNFPPRGWAWCVGQILPISQNTALFSLLGTTYGGDGRSTFALPNLMGSVPMHPGHGPGLSPRVLGESGGSDTVTLLESEIPSHGHLVRGSSAEADLRVVAPGRVLAVPEDPAYAAAAVPQVQLAQETLTPAGGDQPHNNLMPYLTFYFCIALQGVFPPRG